MEYLLETALADVGGNYEGRGLRNRFIMMGRCGHRNDKGEGEFMGRLDGENCGRQS